MREFVTSFFKYSTEHGFQFPKEKVEEFLGLLNDMKAGPSHRTDK